VSDTKSDGDKAQRPRDLNQLAREIVDEATDDEREPIRPREKDTAAVERGKARASALTPERRREIARKAARARWGRS
jgi:hypothetical protein